MQGAGRADVPVVLQVPGNAADVVPCERILIDYQQQDFALEVKQITQGKGADVILDHIGGVYLSKNNGERN